MCSLCILYTYSTVICQTVLEDTERAATCSPETWQNFEAILDSKDVQVHQ